MSGKAMCSIILLYYTVAQHHVFHQHEIDLEGVEIIDKSTKWSQRLILEAWHSVQEVNSINEHIAFPDIYKIP